jgi:predicted ATP-dependent serine protease
MVARTLEYRQERKSAEEIKTLLPEFAEEYKHLFEMITAPEGFDANNLNMMLAMLERMGQGSLSQHEASVVVGKRLFDKYGKK